MSVTHVMYPVDEEPSGYMIQYDYRALGENTYQMIKCLSSFHASCLLSHVTRVWMVCQIDDNNHPAMCAQRCLGTFQCKNKIWNSTRDISKYQREQSRHQCQISREFHKDLTVWGGADLSSSHWRHASVCASTIGDQRICTPPLKQDGQEKLNHIWLKHCCAYQRELCQQRTQTLSLDCNTFIKTGGTFDHLCRHQHPSQ